MGDEIKDEVVVDPDESTIDADGAGGSEEKVETEENLEPDEDGFVASKDMFPKEVKRAKDLWKENEITKAEKQQLQKKHDLLRDKPDEYFKKYPGEKPAQSAFSFVKEEKTSSPYANVQVNENVRPEYKEYVGMSIAEVGEIDPTAAADMITDIKFEEREKTKVADDEDARLAEACDKEVTEFYEALSQKHYGKERKDLSDAEKEVIEAEEQAVIKYGKKYNIINAPIEMLWRLKNFDKEMADAKKSGASSLIDRLQDTGNAESIGGGKVESGSVESDYMAMTKAQIDDKVAGMGTAELKSFYKSAPSELKAKHPHIPW